MVKKDTNFIIDLFEVYEEIIRLEKKFGKYVPIKSLEKSLAKRKKDAITPRKLKILLNKLLTSGVIFFPRGGVVQRLFTFDWEGVNK